LNEQHLMESINPATGEVFAHTQAFTDQAVEQALTAAQRQARTWAQSAADERRALLCALADELEQGCERLAQGITAEMGKLIGEARAEVEKCAWVCRFYAEHAEAFLADELIDTDATRSLVAYQPLGPVLAVMPWNFPLWQVFRFAAPALAAGNIGLLKHASNVMLCSAAIEDVFRRAGAPAGLFSHLPVPSDRLPALIADPRVRAVTLTGSEAAGRAVGAHAGKALKTSVLELGGSDPFVVLEDADLERAVDKAVQSRFMNAGQSCIAAKRFIVVEGIADEFEQRLVSAVGELQTGDPMQGSTTLAPMARGDLRDEVHEQVQEAVTKGAALLAGGKPVEGPGYFYPGTVITALNPNMRVYREEVFGPVASILRVRDEANALELANDCNYGLGGSVWTQDRERGERFARRLDCGCAFVNELVKSDPRIPFGGIKDSGYGRELSRLGIREFVNAKTIWVN